MPKNIYLTLNQQTQSHVNFKQQFQTLQAKFGRNFALNEGYNFLQVFFQLPLDPILFNA